MKNLAIIPARSGSKGLPHKNIRPLAGKPLMAWSIEAALKSGMFDTVMVSTDSEEYAEIARSYGAEVPFLRSPELSTDTANSWDVVAEVLNEYEKLGCEFDTLMLLQPTSPLRMSDDIRRAYEVMNGRQGNAVVGVCECEHNPLVLVTAFGPSVSYGDDKVLIKEAFEERYHIADKHTYLRRQDLPKFYRVNGSLYLVKVARFKEDKHIYDENCFPYFMSQENSIDVDTELDFIIAEAVFKHTKIII